MNLGCPDCGSVQERTDKLIAGYTVVRCSLCRVYMLDGDDEKIPFGPLMMRSLRLRAAQLDAARIEREILTSEANDPRWTVIE